MEVDWSLELRREARAVVAKSRASRGLPPWNWREPLEPLMPNQIPTRFHTAPPAGEGVDLSSRSIEKTCKCGCNQTLITQYPKPNHEYIRGHKPAGETVKPRNPGLTREQTEPLIWIGIIEKLERELSFLNEQFNTLQDERSKLEHNIQILNDMNATLSEQALTLGNKRIKLLGMIESAKQLKA